MPDETPTSDLVQCSVSGEWHERSEMLSYDNRWIAPEHKERFIQSLGESVSQPEHFRGELKALITWWEKRRLIFNICLGALGLFMTFGLLSFSVFGYLFGVGIYAIVVNVFYSIGPLIDIYFKVYRNIDIGLVRDLMFVVGFLFSLGITFVLSVGSSF